MTCVHVVKRVFDEGAVQAPEMRAYDLVRTIYSDVRAVYSGCYLLLALLF